MQMAVVVDEVELLLLRLLNEYTRHPFYGSRKMIVRLRAQDYIVNRKRVQRLMRTLVLVAMAPDPNTSKKTSTEQNLSLFIQVGVRDYSPRSCLEHGYNLIYDKESV